MPAPTPIPDLTVNGGDALSGADNSAPFYGGDQGGMFSPMYFGGSGGGATGFLSVVILGVVLWWVLKSR